MNTAKNINITAAEPIRAIHALPSDAAVVRRPHFQLREDSLFFLISQRPFAVLNHAEQNLWNVLENEASVGALRASLGDWRRKAYAASLPLTWPSCAATASWETTARNGHRTAYGRCGIKCWRC